MILKEGAVAECQDELEENGLAPAWIYTLPLDYATKAVILLDEDRTTRRREWYYSNGKFSDSDDEAQGKCFQSLRIKRAFEKLVAHQ